MIELHPSGFLVQDLTAPRQDFPPHYRGAYRYADDPFCGERADRDRACRELTNRAFSRQVENGMYVLTPLLTDPELIRDYRDACYAGDIPTRWLFLHTDSPALHCDISPLPPMTLLGYEVFRNDVVDDWVMLELFGMPASDPAGACMATHRARLNENGLFATARDCRVYLDDFIRLAISGDIEEMDEDEASDFCVAAVCEVADQPIDLH